MTSSIHSGRRRRGRAGATSRPLLLPSAHARRPPPQTLRNGATDSGRWRGGGVGATCQRQIDANRRWTPRRIWFLCWAARIQCRRLRRAALRAAGRALPATCCSRGRHHAALPHYRRVYPRAVRRQPGGGRAGVDVPGGRPHAVHCPVRAAVGSVAYPCRYRVLTEHAAVVASAAGAGSSTWPRPPSWRRSRV